MPLDIHIDDERRRVSLHASGVLTDEDVFRVAQTLRESREEIYGFDMLADLSGTEKFEVSTGAVRSLSMEGIMTGDGSRRAVVAHTLVAYGVGRMYAMLRGESAGNLAVFRTRVEAVAWLEQADRRRGAPV